MTKTFLLGVGAQKAGTSWLHNFLASQPGVRMGFWKEIHHFDVLTLPHCQKRQRVNYKQALSATARRAIGQLLLRHRLPILEPLEVFRFDRDEERYFDYFAGILNRDGVILTGDITPNYSGLSEATYARIRDGFARRGIRLRVVFLMRDPVERCWSDARMAQRFEIARRNRKRPQPSAETLLLERYLTPAWEIRARYDQTVERLERVFAPEEIILELHERLFTPDTCHALMDRLGLPFTGAPFERVVYGGKKANLSPATRQILADHYRDIYAFAESRFGAETVRTLWQNERLARHDRTLTMDDADPGSLDLPIDRPAAGHE